MVGLGFFWLKNCPRLRVQFEVLAKRLQSLMSLVRARTVVQGWQLTHTAPF